MHALCAFSTLFLSALLTVQAAVLSPFDITNQSSVSSLDVRNSSNGLTGLNPLPTSIYLIFDLFGSQMPSSAVNAAFNGAITRITPFLTSRPNDPISNDDFRYRAVGGSVQIGVTVVLHHRVSWQQLDVVLRQAASFMNGDLGASRQHMQELSFEIMIDGTRIGDGLVSYFPSLSLQLANSTFANLTNQNDTRVLLAAIDRSIDLSTVGPIPYPIPNSPFALLFDFLGKTIPKSNVCAAFEGAYLAIYDSLSLHPDSPISSKGFEYEKDGVHIAVFASKGVIITWKQLSCILGGLYGFMTGNPEHYQYLTCGVILLGRYSVGLASIGYRTNRTPSMEVAKRALLDTTVSLPPVVGVLGNIPFPDPETPIIITFADLGTSIPWRELDQAVWAALEQTYGEHGTDPVPDNHFFLALKGVRITVLANVPHLMSWIQLHDILWGLMLFVTGAGEGGEHFQVLDFDVDDIRTGKLAYGTLRYTAHTAPSIGDL